MTAFIAKKLLVAKYKVEWQSKIFYCYHTDDDYDLEDDHAESSDSDDYDTSYGQQKEVYK